MDPDRISIVTTAKEFTGNLANRNPLFSALLISHLHSPVSGYVFPLRRNACATEYEAKSTALLNRSVSSAFFQFDFFPNHTQLQPSIQPSPRVRVLTTRSIYPESLLSVSNIYSNFIISITYYQAKAGETAHDHNLIPNPNMAKFNWKANPAEEPRWRGTQRYYFTTWSLTGWLVIVFALIAIAEGYFEARRVQRDSDEYWLRIGLGLIPQVTLGLVIWVATSAQKWHPIAALATCIPMAGLWLGSFVINLEVVRGGTMMWLENEKGLKKTWEQLCYAEMALQVLFCVGYLVMFGFAGKAVHEWRKTKAYGGFQQSAKNVENC